jgi:protein-S-isoprenylcysteine O-methyltransferase Ste14
MGIPSIMMGSKEIKKGIILWTLKNAIFVVMLALILFLGSGTLDWAMAWAYIFFILAVIIVTGIVLYRIDPSLLAERSGYQEGAKKYDLVLASLIAVWLPMFTYLIAALNKRFGWAPEVPFWLQTVSFILMVIGAFIILWAMATNKYFSAVVRIQEDRGHQVVSTGPYRYIRHPGYVSVFFLYPGTALFLGSIWALIPSILIIILTIIRTSLEDRTLQKELPGYKEYANKVKYRLIPGIW